MLIRVALLYPVRSSAMMCFCHCSLLHSSFPQFSFSHSLSQFIIVLFSHMSSGEKPMSIKDRIAKFQGLMGPSPPNPQLKPPHTSKPPSVTLPTSPTPVVTPSHTNKQHNAGGQVESPSIVKPSATKGNWNIVKNNEKDTPSKKVEVTTTKPNVWPPTTDPSPKKPLQVPSSVRPTRVWPPPSENEPASNVQKTKVQQQTTISQNSIKEMLEGKAAMSGNRQSFPIYSGPVFTKVEKEGSSGQVVVNKQGETGTVQGNTKKLNQFFQTQRENELKKPLEGKETLGKSGAEDEKDVTGGDREWRNRGRGEGLNFLPGFVSEGRTAVGGEGGSGVGGRREEQGEESIVVRLKKKKRARVRFSSSESD